MAVWCPHCGAEYVEGWSTCSECGVGLVRTPPPEDSYAGSFEPRAPVVRDRGDPFIDIWEGPTPEAESLRRQIEARFIPVETEVGIDVGRSRVQVPRSYLADVRDVVTGVAPAMPEIAVDTLDGYDWKPIVRLFIVATAAVLVVLLLISQF